MGISICLYFHQHLSKRRNHDILIFLDETDQAKRLRGAPVCIDDGEDDDDDNGDNDDDEDDETDQAEIEGCSSVNGEGEGDVHVSPGVVASRAAKGFLFCF